MAISTNRSSHATTGTTSNGWPTSKIAVCALFVAVAMITSFMEIPVPPVAWLKYDPSFAVCLVAGFAFGPGVGAIVGVLSWLPHLFMDPWGGLMSIVCGLAFVLPASLIYAKNRSAKGMAIGMAVSFVAVLVVSSLSNIVVTPLYTPTMTSADVIAMLVPALLPFNAVKAALNCVICAIAYKPLSKVLEK